MVCQWPCSDTKLETSTVVHPIQFLYFASKITSLFVSHLPINSELISLFRRCDDITVGDLAQRFGSYQDHIGSLRLMTDLIPQ